MTLSFDLDLVLDYGFFCLGLLSEKAIVFFAFRKKHLVFWLSPKTGGFQQNPWVFGSLMCSGKLRLPGAHRKVPTHIGPIQLKVARGRATKVVNFL